MARPLRIEYPGAWYHVMNRGRRKEKIFFEKKDYKLFLEILRKTIDLFAVEIHAYVLLPNHYHLLIRTPDGNLSRSMRHLNGVYAQRLNKYRKMDGSLFRGRYKSILVEKETYLLELLRYIHRNPIEAGMEDKLGEYEWCSLPRYLKKNKKEEWLKTGYILKQFDRYENKARRKFRSFVEKSVPKDILRQLEGRKCPAVLGGKEFKEKIIELIRGNEIVVDEIPEYRRDLLEKTKKEALLNVFLKNRLQVLRDKGTRKYSMERRALIYVLRAEFSLTLKEIGLKAGGVKYTAISNQYRKAEEDIKRGEGCCEEVRRMAGDLKWKMKI